MTKDAFLISVKKAAMNIGQKWPGYVAAEAALESAFGSSVLARVGMNLFGIKAHDGTPLDQTLSLPTKEYYGGAWVKVMAHWMKYADWEACLRDRQATLVRLAPHYPHYAAALAADTGEDFVREVSLTWSTDPHRADKVLDIYSFHQEVLA